MESAASPLAARRAVLATMHGKERAIGPAFLEVLGIEIEVPGALDTDQFGTFSGEVDRPGSMEDVLVAKARLGLRASGLDLAVASEGSFGPHPQIPFIPVGLEKLVLMDARSGLVAFEHHFDMAPCYTSWEARHLSEIADHVRAAGFPDQAMIVRPGKGSLDPTWKGIRDFALLEAAIEQAARASGDGTAFIQTDMRAHCNPRRMHSIALLAKKFADRLCHKCPDCSAPGWGIKRTEKGLPCSWCGAPTEWVLHEVLGCFACEGERLVPRSDRQTEAEPMHCAYCNP